MDRQIIYTQEQARSYDFLSQWKDNMLGLAYAGQDINGTTTTVVGGLAASTTGALSLAIGAGRIYQQANADTAAYSSLPADTTQILQQGIYLGGTVTFTTSGLSSGQSFYALVEAQFTQTDVIPSNDPTAGVLTYVNPANPNQPFIGPGNAGTPQNTRRTGIITLQVVYGAAATTGSQVPPSVTGGWVPLYLVPIAFGQTSVVTFYTAGPSVGPNVPSNYPNMPTLAGLLNSHHGGTVGQAPQIKLASEVQGTLGLANLPASNTTGTLPVIRSNSGDPNGVVAGNVDDLVLDTLVNDTWICVTTGSSSTAVWARVGSIPYNAVINGSCIVAQRASATLTTTPTYAGVDRWAAYAANAPSAGTIQQSNTTLLGSSGYALQLAGVSITGASSVSVRYRIESRDAYPFVNQNSVVALPVYQDTGGSINYTITIASANVQDNFSTVTTVATSSSLPVASATATPISFAFNGGANAGNGLQITITATTTATITTKNFYFTELQMRLGAVVRRFIPENMGHTVLKCRRYCQLFGQSVVGWAINGSNLYEGFVVFAVPMRAAPTVSIFSGSSINVTYPANNGTTANSISISSADGLGGILSLSFATGGGAGTMGAVSQKSCLLADAEL